MSTCRDESQLWKDKLQEFASAKQKADRLRDQASNAADGGNLTTAIKLYEQAEKRPWQRAILIVIRELIDPKNAGTIECEERQEI